MGEAQSMVKDFILAFQTQPLIHNVQTQLQMMTIHGHEFVVSNNYHNPNQPINSYVVSPTTAYGHYALAEIKRLGKPLTTWPLCGLVLALRQCFQWAKLDNIIHINNWLLSTNIYPDQWCAEGLAEALTILQQQHPHCAIGLRSLNDNSNIKLLTALQNLDFLMVPSRQVYLFDFRHGCELLHTRHNNRMDALLLRKSNYQQSGAEEFSAEDFARAEYLYRDLYVGKYSTLNPQYSAQWLLTGVKQGWLELVGLRNKQGILDGITGWFIVDSIVTAPIVGYDTSLPKSLGLYRLLTHLCLVRAARDNKVLNFSSGAAHFKRLRGGVPAIEYSAVYIQHLAFWRRGVWRILAFLLTHIAVPLMRRWQL